MGAVRGRRPGGRRVAPRRRSPRLLIFCRQDGGHSTGLERVSPPAEHSDTVHAGWLSPPTEHRARYLKSTEQ